MNGKDFAIGVLSVTAAILFTGLMLLQTLSPPPAMAGGAVATVGEYVITTSLLDDATEILAILDTNAQKLNFYGLSPAVGQIELIQQIDVKRNAAKPRR